MHIILMHPDLLCKFQHITRKKKISQDNTHALAPASDLYAESLQSKSRWDELWTYMELQWRRVSTACTL